MVRVFFILPLTLVLILFPHVIVSHNTRILNTPTPEGSNNAPAPTAAPEGTNNAGAGAPQGAASGSHVEIPNMHQIGAPQSQQNKPNMAAAPPSGDAGHSTQPQPQGQGAALGQGQNPAIEQACAPTQNKQLCIDSLKAEPLSTSADLKSLAFISLNVTKNEANKISEWLYNQLDDPELGASIQQAFTDCAEQYTDAVAQVEDSMLAFFANAYNDIEVWMNTAISNAGTCEEALKTGNAVQTVGNKNEVFKQLCTNSLAIISKLMKH